MTRIDDAPGGQGEAPQGPVRGHGDGDGSRRRRSSPGSRARSPALPSWQQLIRAQPAPSPADHLGDRSLSLRSRNDRVRPASPAAYQQQSILTATPERLVVMLYDGAIRFLFQAAAAMREGARATAVERLDRGEAIVDHLLATLDMSRRRDRRAARGHLRLLQAAAARGAARARRRQARPRARLPRRAARGVGPDRRRMTAWHAAARARRARAGAARAAATSRRSPARRSERARSPRRSGRAARERPPGARARSPPCRTRSSSS